MTENKLVTISQRRQKLSIIGTIEKFWVICKLTSYFLLC